MAESPNGLVGTDVGFVVEVQGQVRKPKSSHPERGVDGRVGVDAIVKSAKVGGIIATRSARHIFHLDAIQRGPNCRQRVRTRRAAGTIGIYLLGNNNTRLQKEQKQR